MLTVELGIVYGCELGRRSLIIATLAKAKGAKETAKSTGSETCL